MKVCLLVMRGVNFIEAFGVCIYQMQLICFNILSVTVIFVTVFRVFLNSKKGKKEH